MLIHLFIRPHSDRGKKIQTKLLQRMHTYVKEAKNNKSTWQIKWSLLSNSQRCQNEVSLLRPLYPTVWLNKIFHIACALSEREFTTGIKLSRCHIPDSFPSYYLLNNYLNLHRKWKLTEANHKIISFYAQKNHSGIFSNSKYFKKECLHIGKIKTLLVQTPARLFSQSDQ